MTVVLALENLYDGVRQRFFDAGLNVPNLFGWRYPAQHQEGPLRIAWVPGDPSLNIGNTLPARNPGGIPRTLAVLDEYFTVYISGQDPSDPENERKQYHVTRLLRDAWLTAVYHVAHGTFQVRNEAWDHDNKNERRWGATLRLTCTIQSPVWDALADSDVVDAVQDAIDNGTRLGASIDVYLVDHEVIALPPGELPPVGGGEVDGGGGTQTQHTKNLVARATHSDGDLACDVAVQTAPAFGAFVYVSVNGVLVTDVGDGTKSGAECYFSGDNGDTARTWDTISVADTLHWQGSVAGYQLAPSDVIDFWYEERG